MSSAKERVFVGTGGISFSLWHLTIPVVLLISFTVDRVVHFLWAAVFWIVGCLILSIFFMIFRRNKVAKIFVDEIIEVPGVLKKHVAVVNMWVIYFGSWLPDIDWMFMSHRNPLTHSILPFLLMQFLVKKYGATVGNEDWNWRLLSLFGYALSSHLVTDIIPGGNVVFFPAKIDMPFLAVNGLITFWCALKIQIKRRKLSSEIR